LDIEKANFRTEHARRIALEVAYSSIENAMEEWVNEAVWDDVQLSNTDATDADLRFIAQEVEEYLGGIRVSLS
jgi:hypothetical protein